NSVRRAQAPARSIRPGCGTATCRWTSWRRATAPRARGRGCGAPRPFAGACPRPWRDTSRLPSPSWCPWESRARGLLELLLQRLDLSLQGGAALHHRRGGRGGGVGQTRRVGVEPPPPPPVTKCSPAGAPADTRFSRPPPPPPPPRPKAAAGADGEAAD